VREAAPDRADAIATLERQAETRTPGLVPVRYGRMAASELRAYAETCGWKLARAHARSADRVAIGAYLGASDRFDRAVATFAEIYADQNERDHEALVAAIGAGRIAADPER
jgi:hypothetical protein